MSRCFLLLAFGDSGQKKRIPYHKKSQDWLRLMSLVENFILQEKKCFLFLVKLTCRYLNTYLIWFWPWMEKFVFLSWLEFWLPGLKNKKIVCSFFGEVMARQMVFRMCKLEEKWKKKNKKNDARPGFEPGSPRSEVDHANRYSTAVSL